MQSSKNYVFGCRRQKLPVLDMTGIEILKAWCLDHSFMDISSLRSLVAGSVACKCSLMHKMHLARGGDLLKQKLKI